MREESRNKTILILALLTIIFFISSISSCRNAAKQKTMLSQERLRCMQLEESLLGLSSRNSELEQKINHLQGTLNQQESSYQATQEMLKGAISRLEVELEKVNKLKDKIEEDLKEALVIDSR